MQTLPFSKPAHLQWAQDQGEERDCGVLSQACQLGSCLLIIKARLRSCDDGGGAKKLVARKQVQLQMEVTQSQMWSWSCPLEW